MTRFRARAALPTAVVVIAASTSGFAEPSSAPEAGREAGSARDARAKALELFEQSKVLYERGEFREAAALLAEAHATFPEPVLLYNMARAYQEAGELERAIEAYEHYLSADPEVKDRAGIEQRIVTLREQLRADEPSLETTPPGSESPSRASAGSHPSTPADPPVRGRSEGSATVLPWIVTGAGVAVLGTGFVLGAVANGHHANAEEEPDALKAAAEQEQAEDFALAANASFVAGGIVTAVGAGLWVLVLTSDASPGGARAGTTIALGPASARLRMDF